MQKNHVINIKNLSKSYFSNNNEKELIALRSREITNRPLDEIEDGTRTRWKWANVLLPSLIIAGLGFYRSKNEKTKADILKQIYE